MCGITQSNYKDCHRQLVAFLEKGTMEMVEEEDGADEIEGFDDGEVRRNIDENVVSDGDESGED